MSHIRNNNGRHSRLIPQNICLSKFDFIYSFIEFQIAQVNAEYIAMDALPQPIEITNNKHSSAHNAPDFELDPDALWLSGTLAPAHGNLSFPIKNTMALKSIWFADSQ